MKQEDHPIWLAALTRLRKLDQSWADATLRCWELERCRDWMEQQSRVPRLTGLARLLTSGMTRQQFWSVLVPVERAVARGRVTDIDILDADRPMASGMQAPQLPLTVVVDSIRSAFNLGGIFRTAECFGIQELVLCGYTPLPDHPQVIRAALGTERQVAWRQVESVRQAIVDLKARQVRCVALETVADAHAIETFAWSFPAALVIGNERFGLDTEVIRLCDEVVRIPLFGHKNSLNVVSAFSIAAHAIRRAL